jgi:hypothetical protein
VNPQKAKYGWLKLEREMYQHPAFLSLCKNAIKTLIAFLDARRFEKLPNKKGQMKKSSKAVCVNGDNLRIPYGLLEKTYRIPRGRIPAAIDELMTKGFIERKYAGGAAKHDMAIYALSEKWKLPGSEKAPYQARKRREHHGYQGRPLGAVANHQKVRSANIAHETIPIHTHETIPIQAS